MALHNPLDVILEHLTSLHETHPEVGGFCGFPADVSAQEIEPFYVPPSEALQGQGGLDNSIFPELRDALIEVSPKMMWRETYKGTDIDPDFMERFGCYEIIGRDAPFASEKMRSFLVYQPPHLHYPWHHHPADELYMVISGEAEFHLKGQGSETLKTGQTAFHPSNTPHALTSHDHPVMAYVIWRDNFDVGPVWSES